MKVIILIIKTMKRCEISVAALFMALAGISLLHRETWSQTVLRVHLKCLESFQLIADLCKQWPFVATVCLGFLSCSSVNRKVFKVYKQNTFTPHISASKKITDATHFDAKVPCSWTFVPRKYFLKDL